MYMYVDTGHDAPNYAMDHVAMKFCFRIPALVGIYTIVSAVRYSIVPASYTYNSTEPNILDLSTKRNNTYKLEKLQVHHVGRPVVSVSTIFSRLRHCSW